MLQMTMTVNGVAFRAAVEDIEAGCELAARLPFTLEMGELGSVEKHSYLSEPFGGGASAPTTIEAGDIMAYSGAMSSARAISCVEHGKIRQLEVYARFAMLM